MAMEYFLKQINPANTTPLIICLDKAEVTVGRRSIVSLTHFHLVSRRHATFSNKNGRWFVRDLQSLNKLYVNFKEVNTEWMPLEIGDIIGFGTSSYTEDGGLVCVFAAKNRIKQETFHENESSNFETRSIENIPIVSRIKEDKSFPVKQEVNEMEMAVSAPECTFDSNNIYDPSNPIASRDEYELNQSKIVIKTEPKEADDVEQLGVDKDSSTESLPMKNEKPNVATMSACNNSENNSTSDVKPSLENDVEERKPLCEDAPLKTRIAGTASNECCNEVDENPGLKDSLAEKKALKLAAKLQANIHNAKNLKYFHSQMKKCSVKLVRCDSKYFRWPPEINFPPKCFEAMDENAKKIESNFMEAVPKRNSECHLTHKKPKGKIWRGQDVSQVASNVKTNNRIFSADTKISSDESECEKKYAKISNSNASDKKRTKMETKNQTEVEKSLDPSRIYRRSFEEIPERFKVSEKRKRSFSESHSTKKMKHNKDIGNASSLNNFEDPRPPGNALAKKVGFRNEEILSYSRDESAFYVQRNSFCSKYWTPDYNEFETGEVQESVKPNVFIKKKPTAGRTLLIDPKPMEFRSRRMRGREEWFKEKSSNSCQDSDPKERMSENDNEETLKSSAGKRLVMSREESSTSDQKSPSSQIIASSRGNTLVSSRKNSTELTFIHPVASPVANVSVDSRKNSAELLLPKALVQSGEKSSEFQGKNSVELISSSSIASSRDEFCMEDQELSMKEKSDNSALIKSAAGAIRMNASTVARRRFLVEIKTNADGQSKNEGITEKGECSFSTSVKPTKINSSALQTAEATVNMIKNPKSTNAIVATVSPNSRVESLSTTTCNSFEAMKQISSNEQKDITGNQLPTYKTVEITSKTELKPTSAIAKSSEPQFLPKEVFSKNDKISNDKKIAVVCPNNHDNLQPNNLSKPDPVPYFHTSVKEKITNRVHSTYILSPVKSASNPILIDPTSVEDAANSTSNEKFRSLYLVKSIVHWNPKWLEEQTKNKKPPPMVSKGGAVLPLRYSSYESYIKSFYPMISLEIWEGLFKESKPLWLKKESVNSFYYTVKSNKIQHGFMELQCESIVNEKLSFLPREGNIILLGNVDNGLENSVFGYIHSHKVESVLETIKEWQEVPKEWQDNAKLWTFSVYIKKSKKNFLIGTVSQAYGILNIKNKLQLAEALVGFKDSPIQNDILRPTKEMFAFCKSISKIPRMQLIQTVSEEIKKENPHSKLILINAPAGTGKTGAIIGIIEKLLFTNASKTKLLLCALSDMTVDEIGLRLVELYERFSWRGNNIKFVRFGQSENIPLKLQAFSLEKKVLNMYKEQNKKEFQEREKELKTLEDKINNVLFQEQLKTNNKYRFRKSNDEALKQLLDKLQALKDRSPYMNIDSAIHTAYESAILNDSDVVLATLSSCMHPLMRRFFVSLKNESHACCIIDEISQCTELEVLQCLHPEINRLVLVGDLQQLQPQVSSKLAIKWGFKRSMQERISKLFTVQFSCAPPLSLVEQHRMHSQICDFSSKYFYGDQLLTPVDVDERFQYSPLKPFVVYDILEKEMLNPQANIEDNEPFIIANICAQLLQAVPTATLGVVVPTKDLADLYRIPLSLGNTKLKEIEVNIVENFQGIEKDIIIISCVNPFLFAESDSFLSCEKKMNVAMTRARQSLVICGHVSSLMQYKHWTSLIDAAKLRKCFISVSTLRHIPFVIMKTVCRTG